MCAPKNFVQKTKSCSLVTQRGHKRHKKFAFCVTRLQLLVFWTKFFGAHIPLLAEEGKVDIQKMDPFRFVADGVVSSGPPSKASRTDQ